jgi:hypothetical protein
MAEEMFQYLLRQFIHREPFIPFHIDTVDGKRILVDYPSVVFSGSAGGYLNKSFDLIEFTCDEVEAISAATAEANR